MKNTANQSYDAYVLVNKNNLSMADIFQQTDIQVPYFFTREAYYKFYLPNQINYLKQVLKEQWVFGVNDTPKSNALESLKSGMDSLYWSDYLNTWNQKTHAVTIVKSNDLGRLLLTYNDLSVEDNPLLSVARKVSDNTDFSALSALITDKISSKLSDNIVTAQYKPLITLIGSTKAGQKNADFDQVVKQITKIRNLLNSLYLSNQPTMKAYESVESEDSPLLKSLTSLWESANLMPEPIRQWLQQLVQRTSYVLFSMAEKELIKKWDIQVGDYYQNYLENRYPLDEKSSYTVNPSVFINFFKKGGIVDGFVQKNMRAFLSESSSGGYIWQDFYGVPFSDKELLLKPVSQMRKIQNALFSNTRGDGFEVTLTPRYLSSTLSMVSILYQGKQFVYANGPQLPFGLDWPAANDTSQDITVIFQSKEGGEVTKTYSGNWSLFKFMQANKVAFDAKTGNYQLTLLGSDKKALAVYSINTSTLNNPFDHTLFQNLNNSRVQI